MVKRSKALAILFCLVVQLIAVAPTGSADGTPTVVWETDHAVDGIESYNGDIILLEGNLTVTGTLTFENTELILAGTQNGSCDITVEEGGNLSVLAGSYIHSSDPKAHFTFKVLPDASLWMNGSRLRDCGWDDLGNGTHHAEDLRGLYLASTNATVTNSELSGNGFGLIIDGSCSPLIQNNNISQNDADGIRVLAGATPFIDHNTIVGNALIYPWWFCSWTGIYSDASAPCIANNTLGTVRVQGWTYPRNGITLEGGGTPVVEDNLLQGFDGDGGSFYGLTVEGGTNARIGRNHFSGDLCAIRISGGPSVVTDNLIERGTVVSSMHSYGIQDSSSSFYANNTVKGFSGGLNLEGPSSSVFENLTVSDCVGGAEAYSIPGSTFSVTIANSTFAQNSRDAEATNPHFGPGGTLTLVNPSYDRTKVSAPGASERLIVAWYCRATALFEGDGRPASGALVNFTDAAGALAAQSFAGPDGSAGPFALAEYVLSGGVRTVKTPYTASAASERWTNRTTVQLDRNQNVTVLLDDIPPWIRFESPANGTLTKVASIRVSGSCEPMAAVCVNGVSVPAGSDGRWSVLVPLQEGANRITATATDKGNNAVSDVITVISDTVRPDLVLTAPKDGLLTNDPRLNVTGSAPDVSATLKVNGATVPCGPDGDFRVELELFEGDNTISAECRDAAGNVNSVTRSVVLDTIAPELVITGPKNGTLTKEPAVTLTGRAEPESVVTVNGAPVNLNGNQFSFRLNIAEGDNLFVFLARDRAGNVARASVAVRRDSSAPDVCILAPAEGCLLNSSTVEVRGTTEEGATVKVQGVKVDLQGTEFRINVTLPKEGPSTIAVVAQDAALNLALSSVNVTLDSVPPDLKLTGPAAGTVTNQTSIRITGRSEPGAKVRFGELTVSADSKGAFSFTVAIPAEGKNDFSIEAEDAAGNTAEASISVVLDTVLSYNITSPAPGSRTKERTVLVRGDAEPGAVVIVAGRTLYLEADGSFAGEVPLEVGANELTVLVRDKAGNQGESVLVVTREQPAGGKSTPGFEALGLLVAIGLGLAGWRRKQK